MHIPIFGNGDVNTPERVIEVKDKYGVDGVMIGRASIGYPWIFNEIKHFMATGEYLAEPAIKDRITAARRHLEMSVKWKGETLGVLEMRRHYGNYFKGISHFKEHRMKLVTKDASADVFAALDEIENVFG